MSRLPGYELVGTIRDFITERSELGDEIKDTKIEVYNATTGEEVLELLYNPKSTFSVNLERGNRYTVLIRKQGYFAKRFDVLVNVDGCILCFEGLGSNVSANIIENLASKTEEGTLLTEIGIRPIKINEAIKMDNIYYDLNKWNIRSDARPELDKLVRIMRATPIIVELSSHTDSRGTTESNQTLSQKIAQSAVEYIIATGIASNRITAQGYGENQLVNNCPDGAKCSEVEHQQNRRTEFKVTRLMEVSSFDNKKLKDIIEAEKLNKIRQVEKMIIQ